MNLVSLNARFLGSAKQAPPGLSLSVVRPSVARPSDVRPSVVRPSVFLPRFFLKIEYPTCHVTAGAVKTGLCVNQ